MLPFRHLLKPGEAFKWTEELEKAFINSKIQIIEAVKNGIKTFDLSRKTCVSTDWSKEGVGFVLLQKKCQCTEIDLSCCHDGWVIVFCGSRFTSGPESRYAPVKGEALAVYYALDKCKHFVLGCPDLLVATYHKPLLRILGDRSLQDIENPRRFKIKEKTLRYRYKIMYVPGKEQHTADATSRAPVRDIMMLTCLNNLDIRTMPSMEEKKEAMDIEQAINETIQGALASLSSDSHMVTWERVNLEARQDPEMTEVKKAIVDCNQTDASNHSQTVEKYRHVWDKLSVMEDSIMCGERIIIPKNLRKDILNILHSGHQGTTGMQARARDTVYCPGIDRDIEKKRAD